MLAINFYSHQELFRGKDGSKTFMSNLYVLVYFEGEEHSCLCFSLSV